MTMTKIPLSQLNTLASGICEWSIESDVWTPYRLPLPMRRHYQSDEMLDKRAHCTAGVALRFHTTASRLKIAIRYGVSCRDIGWGSVVVDGKPFSSFGTQSPVGDWPGEIALGDGADQPRLIELWLAHCAQMKIMGLSADAPLFPVKNNRKRWLALGDSITQGAEAQYPINTGICRAARKVDLDLLNLGIGSAHAEKELADLLPDGQFDLITIAYGLNDYAKNLLPADYAAAMATLAAESRRLWPHAPIFMISATSIRNESDLNQLGLKVQHYRDALNSLKLPTATRIIDGPTLTPDMGGIMDNCHPTDEGFAVYAHTLLESIRVS
ncbi:MAG: hypothetical protein IT447_06055 [Phycisphaerales bacterium]|nr:hypothetical protein [Phycisphaerales bacterium]